MTHLLDKTMRLLFIIKLFPRPKDRLKICVQNKYIRMFKNIYRNILV